MGVLTTAAVVGTAAATAYSANRQSKAAKEAARSQERSGERAIDSNERALEQARSDLEVFRTSGQSVLGDLKRSARDTRGLNSANQMNVQGGQLLDNSLQRLNSNLQGNDQFNRESVINNSLYQGLMDNATNRVFANNAARGKLGSGDTLTDLSNNSLALGADIYDRQRNQKNIDTSNLFTAAGVGSGLIGNADAIRGNRSNRLFNVATLGANAASGQSTATLNTGANNASLQTQIGNAQAAGTIGRANAISDSIGDATSLIGMGIKDYRDYKRTKS